MQNIEKKPYYNHKLVDMGEMIKKGRRLFTIGVVLTTIIWSAGFSAFLPLAADAQSLSAGDLIKSSELSSVYYYSQDGKRYVFPNSSTYFTWFSDFSGVKTITAEELAAIPIGGNVVFKPGVKMVKITTDPKVYAVGANGMLHWIETEQVAMGLYGPNWNTMVLDVPDAFFTNYTIGSSLSDANDFSPSSVTAAATSIDVNMGTTAATGGSLSVALAPDNPASFSVPQFATGVRYLGVKVTGGSQATMITGLKAKRTGLGESSDFEDIYLYDGTRRLTDGRSVNSSTHEVFFSGLNLNVPAGQMKTLWIVADMSNPTDSPENAFTIPSADWIETNGTVSGSFPVQGNTVRVVSAATAGTITIERQGTVTNPSVGQKGAEIAKFSLEASTEDVHLERLALIAKGSIDDDDMTNFRLQTGSTVLSEVATVNEDELIVFELNTPYFIEDGDERTYRVYADLRGETGETIQVYLDENTDIMATGADFNAGVRVVSTAYDNSANDGTDASWSELEGGDVTFTFNGPTASDLATDANDAVFMNVTMTAEREVTVKELDVVVTAVDGASANGGLINDGDNGDANLTDIKIKGNGSTLMGPEEINTGGSDTAQTLSFTEDFTLSGGESLDLMFTADINEETPTDETFTFTLDMSTVEIEDENGDTLANTSIVPTADIVSHEQDIIDSDLTVTLASTPVTDTFVSGGSMIPAVGFLFEAADTSDIVMTDITLGAYLDDDGTSSAGDWTKGTDDGVDIRDIVASVSIYDGDLGTLIAGPEDIDTNGEVMFDNFTWTVPAGTTKKMTVQMTVSNNAPDGGNDDAIAFDIDDLSADIEAEDEDGDNVDAGDENAPNSDDAGGAGTLISNAANEPQTYIVITDSGSLTASVDASDPDAEVVVAGTSMVPMYSLKFEADDEGFTVEDLRLANLANADNDNINSVVIDYPDAQGARKQKTYFVTPGTTNGIIDVTDVNFDVPKDDDSVVHFFANLNTIEAGADSGDTPQLDFDVSTPAKFKAIGKASGETLIGNSGSFTDNTVAGQIQTVRKTKPTVTLAASSPSGAGIPGVTSVLEFNVAADAKDDLDVRGFCFDLTSTDNATSDWNTDDQDQLDELTDTDFSIFLSTDLGDELESEDSDWSFYSDTSCTTATADDEVIRSVLLDLDATTDDTEEIAKGTTKKFVVEVDTTGASSTQDDSFRLDVEDIIWNDQEAGGDLTGANIDNLPVRGGTLVY